MTELSIVIQLPDITDITFARIERFAQRFDCTAHKTRDRFYYRITTNDPVNFFWLGANMHNEYFNNMEKSSIAKFIEL